MYRIAPQRTEQTYSKRTKAVKSSAYLAWLHELPCVVTGRTGVQAAHISFANAAVGATGRGKGQKSSDRWAIPLCPDEHAKQHSMNEEAYWKAVGINPHIVALILWGLFQERGKDATQQATGVILSGVGRYERAE